MTMVRRSSGTVILTSRDEEESEALGRLEGLGALAAQCFRYFASGLKDDRSGSLSF